MNIYLLLYHNQTEHLLKLISKLNSKVYVHPCKSLKTIDPQIKKKATVVLKRFYGQWGGFGIVQATIEGVKQILNENKDCTHITLLSGADFPVKKLSTYDEYLQNNLDKSFIKYWDYYPFEKVKSNSDNPWFVNFHVQELRIQKYYFDKFNQRYSVPPIENNGYFEFTNINKLKHYIKTKGLGFTGTYSEEFFQLYQSIKRQHLPTIPCEEIYAGSQWWTISRKHAEYLVEFHQQDKKIREFFKHIMLPDETYIQTILITKYKNEVVNNNLRYIVFDNSSHPTIISMDDKEALNKPGIFFARKFDKDKSKEILAYLNKEIVCK